MIPLGNCAVLIDIRVFSRYWCSHCRVMLLADIDCIARKFKKFKKNAVLVETLANLSFCYSFTSV